MSEADDIYADPESAEPIELTWAEYRENLVIVQTRLEKVEAMVERAAMALRSFSEADDEAMTPNSVRAEARRTLREMRKIGGVNW